MSQLKPVTLKFQGKEYKVDKDDSIWGLIEAIEDVVSFLELAQMMSAGKYQSAKIFRAYTEALNYAGASVNQFQVREAASYQDLGEMGGALLAITMMAQPGKDINLGDTSASESEVDELKKKATGE